MVVYDFPYFRKSRLYFESQWRQMIPTIPALHIGNCTAMDLMKYQLEPAQVALRQPRQRILIADNCTDRTAKAARAAGAITYERFNFQQIGKGYALDYFFQQLKQDNLFDQYDGFFIFDADNLLDQSYISEMNKQFDRNRNNVMTSYRNSKNYDANWISAGSSLWFMREARF